MRKIRVYVLQTGFWILVLTTLLLAIPQAMAQSATEKSGRPLARSLEVQRVAKGRPNDQQQLEIASALLTERGLEPQALDEAANRVAAVLERAPTNVDALMLAGRIALRQAKPSIAALHFRAATSRPSPPSSAWLSLGQSLEAMGDTAGASAAYARYRAARGLVPLPPESLTPAAQP